MNMKKWLASVLALTLLFAMAGIAMAAEVYTVTTVEDFRSKVAGAVSGDTVKLGADITTDDSWKTVKVPSGVIIDGAGKTLTVNNIHHGGSNSILSGSDYTLRNITISSDDSTDCSGISISGGTVQNVTFKGKLPNCICASNGTKVENCTFEGSGWGIYTESGKKVSEVKGCTFNTPRAVALYGNETFSNNKVNGEKGLSVATPNAKIVSNTFSGKRALSISANGAEIHGNKFLGDSTIEISKNCNADLTGNYWGGSKPAAERLNPDNSSNANIVIDGWFSDAGMKNFVDPNAPVAVNMPSTGDNSMLMLWAALLALCSAAFVMKRVRA